MDKNTFEHLSKLGPESKEVQKAKQQMRKQLDDAFNALDKAIEEGTLEEQVRQAQKTHRRQLWYGYVSVTLTILGVVFLWKILLPITLLKVGIFCLWVALGMILNR